MEDILIRATALDGRLRAVVAVTTNLVEEARRRHDTWPTATAALGRTLTAALLLSTTLKGDDQLTLRIIGDGPVGGLVAAADASGHVRGYIKEPHIHLPATAAGKLDVGGAVGKSGFLYVTKDIGLKEPYTGQVPLVSGEIAEDLAAYFAQSEQIPSAVALGVLVETDGSIAAAGGYLIQSLPGVTDKDIAVIENSITELGQISSVINRGKNAYEILSQIFDGFDYRILEERKIGFGCKCNKERLEGILVSLGKEELSDILEQQGHIELRCHFCNESYHFSRSELEDLIKKTF